MLLESLPGDIRTKIENLECQISVACTHVTSVVSSHMVRPCDISLSHGEGSGQPEVGAVSACAIRCLLWRKKVTSLRLLRDQHLVVIAQGALISFGIAEGFSI